MSPEVLGTLILSIAFLVSFALWIGYRIGYNDCFNDDCERVKFIEWNESRGITREDYFGERKLK